MRSALRLTVAIVAVIAPLLVLRYANFAISSAQDAFAVLACRSNRRASWRGIAGGNFLLYVFGGRLSIDVLNPVERTNPEPRLARFALFTSFYPKFVAGPVRTKRGFPAAVDAAKRLDYADVPDGIRIMGGGLLKKLVIADRLAPFVDGVFRNPRDYGGLVLVLTSVCYMFQLYYDFIGVLRDGGWGGPASLDQRPDMELQSAVRRAIDHRLLAAVAYFTDFVVFRVHFRAGRRGAAPLEARRWSRALMATFLASGLWHGARWTFVLYGAAHGTAMSLEYLTANTRKRFRARVPARLYAVLGWALTLQFRGLRRCLIPLAQHRRCSDRPA